ncbi:MAG: RteC domain-containing protein [Bacteroidetes bacterium]|nr:RteC domain-containing protein [Bacteroidota bacterium]
MDKKTSAIHEAMMADLEQIKLTAENILEISKKSYQAVEHYLAELKAYIIDYKFADEQEEIEFFKEIKPMFLKEFLYHIEIFELEAWKPPVGQHEQIAHYKMGAFRADLYFKRYQALYTYYRTRSTSHDEQYFLRSGACDIITSISMSDLDKRFSTIYSHQFAKMQAYERFSDYIYRSIYNLEHPGSPIREDEKGISNIRWTDSKSDLIELAYGIFAKGSVNRGHAEIKQIMTALELAFNTDAGNFYRTFAGLRVRKKNRTSYWDEAKEKLEKSMDDPDTGY